MKSSASQSKQASDKATATNRERILHAAIEVFGHQGLDGARTREIAKRAGVTQPLLAYHFKDKETLWQECAEFIFSDFGARVTNRLASVRKEPVATRLAALFRELIGSAARNPEAHRFMIRYSMNDASGRKKRPRGSLRSTARGDLWVKQIRQAQSEGVLPRNVDPFILRFMLLGAATYAYLECGSYEELTGRDPHDRDVSDKHLQAMISVFLISVDT